MLLSYIDENITWSVVIGSSIDEEITVYVEVGLIKKSPCK